MADSKPSVTQSGWIRALFPVSLLVLGCLWMGNMLCEEHARGQDSPPAPPAVAPLPPPMPSSGGFRRVLVAQPSVRFQFNFPADASLKDLLPIPPKEASRLGRFFVDDLAQVPEVAFQEPLAKSPEALKLTAHTMAKINHLNLKKTDGFMLALLDGRADLAGLPMAMGDTCRMKGDRSQYFSQALAAIKRAKGQGNLTNFTLPGRLS